MMLMHRMMVEGKGLAAPNYIEGAALLAKAAEAGIPQAEHQLAVMYEYGRGIQQDFSLAMKYYSRSAEKLFLESMYNLALMHAFGRGTPQNFQLARSLFDSAASYDHAPSIHYIGVFKTYGYGCEINYQQAVNWFERAAGLDDYRISAQSKQAADDLKNSIAEAEKRNEAFLDQLISRSEQ